MADNEGTEDELVVIGPEVPPSDQPDAYTAKAPDFTSDGDVPDRMFLVNTPWFKYGTNDKWHAASMVLSIVLVALLAVLGAIDLLTSRSGNGSAQSTSALSVIGTLLSLTVGIAVGRSIR